MTKLDLHGSAIHEITLSSDMLFLQRKEDSRDEAIFFLSYMVEQIPGLPKTALSIVNRLLTITCNW